MLLVYLAWDGAGRLRKLSVAAKIALTSIIFGMFVFTPPASHAQQASGGEDANERINAIEQQMRQLQRELNQIRRDLARRNAEVKAARQQAAAAQQEAQQARQQAAARPSPPPAPALPPPPPGFAYNPLPPLTPVIPPGLPGPFAQGLMPPGSPGAYKPGSIGAQQAAEVGGMQGTFQVGGVFVTLGGFTEAAGIWRSRNEVADIASNFNTGIPLPNSQLYYEHENRFSARQSRLSLLATGNPDPETELQAYFETDFQGDSPTANSNQSNSYTLRLRLAYATYARNDWGFYALGGQNWSLATMYRTGLIPRQENVPLTIDAQYVPGFTWTRNPQFRVVKEFDDIIARIFCLILSANWPSTRVGDITSYGVWPDSCEAGSVPRALEQTRMQLGWGWRQRAVTPLAKETRFSGQRLWGQRYWTVRLGRTAGCNCRI